MKKLRKRLACLFHGHQEVLPEGARPFIITHRGVWYTCVRCEKFLDPYKDFPFFRLIPPRPGEKAHGKHLPTGPDSYLVVMLDR